MKAFITVGLGFGDEGKGSIVDFLCDNLDPENTIVVRYSGGCQCGHRVVRNGKQHIFSQFGSGTLAGIRTYMDRNVIINPVSFFKEMDALEKLNVESQLKINFRDSVSFHPKCLVSTVYHRTHNRCSEIEFKVKHGTCGQGIGSCREYWLRYGNDAIFAEDLETMGVLCDKIELMRQRFLYDYPHQKDAYLQINMVDEINKMRECRNICVCDPNLPCYDNVIFEGAQGVLLDENYGWHPNYTWSTVTPLHAIEVLRKTKTKMVDNIEYTIIGITRSYSTRHGEGYFPSHDLSMKFNDPCNQPNQWQGDIRFGPLDLDLLSYSVSCCRSLGTPIDSIAVNCLDQVCHHADFHFDRYNYPAIRHFMKMKNFNRIKRNSGNNSICDLISEISPVSIKGYGASAISKESTNQFKWNDL